MKGLPWTSGIALVAPSAAGCGMGDDGGGNGGGEGAGGGGGHLVYVEQFGPAARPRPKLRRRTERT
jgi:hypothetical protein